MLARTEIREAIVNKLKSSADVTSIVGYNIFNSKVTPFDGKYLPGINVVTVRQDSTVRSLNVKSFNCTLKVNIEIYVSPIMDWTLQADKIAEVVENTLLTDESFTKLFSVIDDYTVEYSMYDQGANPIVVEILSMTFAYFEEYLIGFQDKLECVNINMPVKDQIINGIDEKLKFQIHIDPNK